MAEIEFEIPVLGERGDLTDRELPIGALRLCSNMLRSEKGRLTIRPGHTLLTSTNPTDRVMGIAGFSTAAGVTKQVASTLTKVWSYGSSIWNDITGTAFGGANTDHVRSAVMALAGVYNIILMNGFNAPKSWDGAAGTCSALGGSPGIFIDGMVLANRLVGLVAPETVWISDFNNPAVWPTGAGFRVRLVDSGDLMVGVGRLTRMSGAILGEESQWVTRAQSGSSPFRYDQISNRSGPLSCACIVSAGESKLFWLAKDYNVYQFDGVQCIAVGWAMKPYVKDTIDPSNEKMTHGVFVDQLNKIFWLFPDQTSASLGPNRGIFLDVRTGEMGRLYYASPITAMGRVKIAYGITWDGLASYTWDNLAAAYPTWDSFGLLSTQRKVALGNAAGKVFLMGDGDGSDNGSAIDWAFELPLRAYAGWPVNFVPSTFETFFKQATNSTVVNTSVGSTDTLMADPTYLTMATTDLSVDQRNDLDVSSLGEKRFVSLKHYGSASKGQIEWSGGMFRGKGALIESGPTG